VAKSGKRWNWGTKEKELDFGKFYINVEREGSRCRFKPYGFALS
jgi:hypothetical protein